MVGFSYTVPYHPAYTCAVPVRTLHRAAVLGVCCVFSRSLRDIFRHRYVALFCMLTLVCVCSHAFSETWQRKEIDRFEAAYLEVGKQFAKIASRVGSKSCAECINFYYQWKKKARSAVTTEGPRLVQKRKYPDIQLVNITTTVPWVHTLTASQSRVRS